MKIYICKLCSQNKKVEDFKSTRQGLRKHLREHHFIKSALTNKSHQKSGSLNKQDWWETEEV